MTFKEICDRFDVPVSIRTDALRRAVFIAELQDAWVGVSLDWGVLIKAGLFMDFGGVDETAMIRKKVGMDKFTLSVLSRAVPGRVERVLRDYNWYEMLHLFSVVFLEKGLSMSDDSLYRTLYVLVSDNLMQEPDTLRKHIDDRKCRQLSSFSIEHYKNPSA